jgi:hypothetical protein
MSYDTSAYDAVYSAVVSRLTRAGVTVGKTAFLPRIEVHSITEGNRQDKGGAVRVVSLTVESMSNASLGAATEMNEKNLKLLTQSPLSMTGWDFVGVVPDQLQDLTESSDSDKIVYRLLQSVDIYVQKTETQDVEEVDPDGPIPEDPLMPPDPPEPEVDPEHEDND